MMKLCDEVCQLLCLSITLAINPQAPANATKHLIFRLGFNSPWQSALYNYC